LKKRVRVCFLRIQAVIPKLWTLIQRVEITVALIYYLLASGHYIADLIRHTT